MGTTGKAQKRHTDGVTQRPGNRHQLGKTSRPSPAINKPQASTTPPAWSEIGCDRNSELGPRNSLNHHGGLILPQRHNMLELGLTCFHSLTQKIRYESLPYLPIPWSSIGYLHCFVRYSSENTTPHTSGQPLEKPFRRKGQESVSPNSLSGDCFLLNSCSTSPVGSARLPRTHLIVLSWANWTEVTSQRSAGLPASLPSSPNPAHTAWPSAGQRFIFWVSGRPWFGASERFSNASGAWAKRSLLMSQLRTLKFKVRLSLK